MFGFPQLEYYMSPGHSVQPKQTKNKQDMTVPFARARAKLGGSIRLCAVTIFICLVELQTKTSNRKTYFATFDLC